MQIPVSSLDHAISFESSWKSSISRVTRANSFFFFFFSLFGSIHYQPTNVTNSVTFTYNATRRQGNCIRFIIDVAATGSPALKYSDNLRWNDDLKRQCPSPRGRVRRVQFIYRFESRDLRVSEISFRYRIFHAIISTLWSSRWFPRRWQFYSR